MINMLNLTKENFDSTIATGKALIDFYTEWCGFCRMIEPGLEELSAKYTGDVKVAKVDAESESELAERYDVTTFPTIIAFKDGKEVDRRIGAYPIEVFEEMVENL